MPVTDPQLKAQLALAGEDPDQYDDPVPTKDETPWYDKSLISNLPEELKPDLSYSGVGLLSKLGGDAFHKGVVDRMNASAEGLTTPKNIALAGAAMVPILSPLVAGYFAVSGAGQAYQGGKKSIEDYNKGDKEALGGDLVDTGMGGLMAVGGGMGVKEKLLPNKAKPLEQTINTPDETGVITREDRLLNSPRIEMPEFQDETLGINRNQKALPAPGESDGSILLPESPLGPRTAGYRVKVPPFEERPAIDIESEVVTPEEKSKFGSLVKLSEGAEPTGNETAKAPTVNTDLRQLEKVMKGNTVSKLESWADGVVKEKMSGVSSNPYLDPEFLSAAAVKGAILVKRGVTDFIEWSEPMIQQFGDGIMPHLKELHEKLTENIKPVFTYKGKQETPKGFPGGDIHLFDLNQDIPGHPKGSTVTERTLREKGFDPTQQIPKEPIVSKEEAPPVIKDEPTKIESVPPKIQSEDLSSEPEEIFWPVIRPEASKAPYKVRQVYNNFADDLSLMRGKYVNDFHNKLSTITGMGKFLKKFNSPIEYFKQNTPDMEAVVNYRRDGMEGILQKPLTPIQAKINEAVTESNDSVRNAQVANKVGRDVSNSPKDPNYLATRLKPEVADILRAPIKQRIGRNPTDNSASFNTLKDAYIKNEAAQILRKSPNVAPPAALITATKHFNELVNSMRSDFKGNKGSHYGPIDEASGFYVPRSWQSNNLLDIQSHYLDRVARRFAYDKNVIKNLANAKLLEDNKGIEAVKSLHNDMAGTAPRDLGKMQDAFAIIKSAAMSVYSSGRNVLSAPFYGAQHMGVVQLPKVTLQALGRMKENIADGYASGRIKSSMHSLELDAGFEDVSNTLKRVRDVVSDVDTRNWGEKMSRAISIGQSHFATLDFLNEQSKGRLSVTGKKWFQDFGKDTNWKSGTLTPEEMVKISGRFVDSVQGTYDLRSNPKWATEGNLAPYFSLAKFSIDKSNNYMKYVVNPALQGNALPLLTSTIGIILGGTAVKQLYFTMTGHKGNEATLKELQAANKEGLPTKAAAAYTVAGLASASGHIGFLGDIVKSILDVTYGKNRPQLYNNIMVEAASNVATTAANMASTIAKNGYDFNVIKEGISKMLNDNIQGYRVIIDHLSQDRMQQNEKGNKLRDLRVFDTIAGNDISDRTSPFKEDLGNLKLKNYQKEPDLNKSMQMVPLLIDDAIKKAGDNPEKLKKELGKIQGENYPTMPSLQDDKINFQKYYQFLVDTKGEKEADKVMQDYIEHQITKKIKTLPQK